MKIEAANFKMIESELYCYKDSLKYIADMEDDIINSTGGQSEIHASGVSDITGNKAMRLASNRELIECKRRVQAIDSALQIVSISGESKKYEMIKMKYFDKKYTDYGIQKELPISRRTFYRWRKDVIELIAFNLGCRI